MKNYYFFVINMGSVRNIKVAPTLRRGVNCLASLRLGLGRAPTLDLTPDPKLSDEVKRELYALQLKGIDIDEMILETIRKRKEEISKYKEEFAQEQDAIGNSSRHIPRKIERLIQKEHGNKCFMPNCQNEADEIHHEIPFALLRNHNPHFLKPLCDAHHILAHRIHAAYEEIRKKAVAVQR